MLSETESVDAVVGVAQRASGQAIEPRLAIEPELQSRQLPGHARPARCEALCGER